MLRILVLLLALILPLQASAKPTVVKMDKLERETKQESVDIAKLHGTVARMATNPEDVKFRRTATYAGAAGFVVFCGEANITGNVAGKGWQRFVYAGDDPLFAEDGNSFERAWERHCE